VIERFRNARIVKHFARLRNLIATFVRAKRASMQRFAMANTTMHATQGAVQR